MVEPWESKDQGERWLGGAQAPRLWWIRGDRASEASEFRFKQQTKLARKRQRSHESTIHQQRFFDNSKRSTTSYSPRATEEQSHWWPKLTDIGARSILAHRWGSDPNESRSSDCWAQAGDRSTPSKAPSADKNESTPRTTRETVDTAIKRQGPSTRRDKVCDCWFERLKRHQLRGTRESWESNSKAQFWLPEESGGCSSYTRGKPEAQRR